MPPELPPPPGQPVLPPQYNFYFYSGGPAGMPGLGPPPPPPGEGSGGEGGGSKPGSEGGGEGEGEEEGPPPPPIYVQGNRSFSSPRQVAADGEPVKENCTIM
ncbi:hypothetical protein INT43_006529 [Umbelopsis isabellina]|uniref:Uncharacterized protein n=1 Tax=Mortierella isabellina TaxID=91625 RepID=A0A8H7Q197_MORIS|nr:hypothetical protein INT43_006529 [Umbelopsis isabellina]